MTRRGAGGWVALWVLWLLACGDPAAPESNEDAAQAAADAAGASQASADGGATSPSGTGAPSTSTGTAGLDAGAGTPQTRDAGLDARTSGSSEAGSGQASRDARVDAEGGGPSPEGGAAPSAAIWRPKPGTTWQWDLSGKVSKLDVAAEVYDIDGFENGNTEVSQLHALGKKVICYISVGTYEPARPDAKDFPKAALGKYWPEWDETYIDIRSEAVRAVMKKRLDMCQSKGFDGIEPDNMDMFEGGMSDTGFPLTEADGIAYAKWLADEAHARGLSIGQKNASSITEQIEGFYDWALTEDCYADEWCDDMKAYSAHDKAMFMCEYTDTKIDFAAACSAGKAQKFSPILKKRELDSWIEVCK